MADARFLAIPHGIHGLGADYGDLSSAFYALFGKSRLNTQNEPQSVGVHGGRRNGRAGIFGGYIAGGTRGLDNLVFVVNCNLQRLDGPVRGNGKIIQELEAVFRGAGWNAIKIIWGSYWDTLLYQDKKGLLQQRMEEVRDGDYQTYRANSGAYIREHFFGKYPELKAMVASMTDEDIWRLNRGGHDPHKVYAAYHAAFNHVGQPTVILAKTIKGYGMETPAKARNIAHQQKKISTEAIIRVRDRYGLPIADDKIGEAPFYKPPADAPEMKYLQERISAMGGGVPSRKNAAPAIVAPPLSCLTPFWEIPASVKFPQPWPLCAF